jgi:hypothetical protein
LLNLLIEMLAGRRTMKKISYASCAVVLVLSLVVPIVADTIRLKDGSVIRGQVIDFKDQQFTILIGAGTKGRRSRTSIYVEDIESIEFDSATTAAAGSLANESMNSGNSEPVSQPPRTNPQPDTTTSNPRPNPGASPTFFTIKVAVRADNRNNGWNNSGLVVRKGQRLRISASGRVSLGKDASGNQRWSTPIGDSRIPDKNKLMGTEATGGLIAVIGDDNDDFIFIGNRRDFVAQRDGVLFLGVNEGDLNDNTGTYDVVIEAEAGSSPR